MGQYCYPLAAVRPQAGTLGPSLPTGYSAWLTAASAVANPTATDKSAVSALLASMAANNFLLTDFDYIYLMIGTNGSDTSTQRYNQKRINLVKPGTFDATITNPNASGHVSTGTLGNNSMYWDTGLNTSTRTVDRTNAASWGVINSSLNSDAGSPTVNSGWEDGTNTGYLQIDRHEETQSVYNYGNGSFTIAITTPPKLYWINCQSNNAIGYLGATSQKSVASANKSFGTRSIYIFGVNAAGTASYLSKSTIAMSWHGRNFSAGDITNWYSIWQTFMTVYGVAI